MIQVGGVVQRAVGTLKQPCKHLNICVIHTWRSGHVIKRRRRCIDCQTDFSTEERLPYAPANTNAVYLRVKSQSS